MNLESILDLSQKQQTYHASLLKRLAFEQNINVEHRQDMSKLIEMKNRM